MREGLGEKFLYQEDWGEANTKHKSPRIVRFDWEAGQVEVCVPACMCMADA